MDISLNADGSQRNPDGISKAELSDAPGIAAINEQFNLDIPEFRWGKHSWVEEEIRKGNYCVTRDDKGVAGTLCLELASKEHRLAGVIEAMAIRSDLRGKGLGRMMIDHAKDICKHNPSVRRLVVESFCEYDPSVKRFYDGYGFHTAPKHRVFQGHEYYYMWMPLERQQQPGDEQSQRAR